MSGHLSMNFSLRNGSGSSRGENEIMVELETGRSNSQRLNEDFVFVALGKDDTEGMAVLPCALELQRTTKKKICILHVYQPTEKIPMGLGATFAKVAGEDQIRIHNQAERQKMLMILQKYVEKSEGTGAQVVWTENICIEKGIVELIAKIGIKWLIMGGAPKRYNPKRVKELKSTKAKFVREEAPSFCYIWFVCQGSIIEIRPSTKNKMDTWTLQKFQGSPNRSGSQYISRSPSEAMRRSFSTSELGNGNLCIHIPTGINSHSVRSDDFDLPPSSSNNSEGALSPIQASTCSSSEITADLITCLSPITEATENGHGSDIFPGNDTSMKPSALEARLEDIDIQHQQSNSEAESSRNEEYEDSMKHKKVEKDLMDAVQMAKTSQKLRFDELKNRRELEESLAKSTKSTEEARLLLDNVLEELKLAKEQKFFVEQKVLECDGIVDDLEHKMYSAVDLLNKYKKERDELQIERDNALKETEELKKRGNGSSEFFLRFTLSEIKEATNNFDPSFKIGEGGYGSIYRCNLRHTEVAIKILKPGSSQGLLEFQNEVNALSKLRHPNIITLIGACPEVGALIYEYLSNGSLEDHLKCKDNTPPLSWKTRIRISIELCSALIFLHSCSPRGFVHGDLKPSNILLDAYNISKLSDFGICYELPQDEFSENDTTRCFRPKNVVGTWGYIDPQLVLKGELTSRSDVYSFGVILLRLLTGKPAAGIINEVETALKIGNLKDILDPTAGDWPFLQAEQLARIAIRCAESLRRDRANLISEVWRVLEPMKLSCGISSISEKHSEIPSYFVCPIFQEIMQDPIVAADGFTYESEALKGWIESGHNNSPMTNVKLSHFDVVPNHALRSAISEWLQGSKVAF